MLQKAYKENLPLVGPEGISSETLGSIIYQFHIGDPDGWHTLPPLVIQGKMFDSHSAEVTLSVSDHPSDGLTEGQH